LIGALDGYDPETKNLNYDQLLTTDKIALNNLYVLDKKLWELFRTYAFDDMAKAIKTYIAEDLSAVYFMATKHR